MTTDDRSGPAEVAALRAFRKALGECAVVVLIAGTVLLVAALPFTPGDTGAVAVVGFALAMLCAALTLGITWLVLR